MRIGVLTHNYPRFQGDYVGSFIEASCRELARQGQQVTVLAPYDPAFDRPMREDLGEGAIDLILYRYAWPRWLHRVGYGRSMRSDLALRLEGYLLSPAMIVSGILSTWRWVRRTRPDVLHAHWVLPNGFIGAVVSRITGVPLVVSVPGSDAQVARSNALFGAMARFAFMRAGVITANSADLRDAVASVGADPAKFDMIVYSTDANRLHPDHRGVAELRSTLGIGANDIALLAVGRMVPKKGFDDLVRAMADAALRSRAVVAVLIGDGDEWAAWQALGRQLGVADRLRWVGRVAADRIATYYNAADVMVMPAVTQPADGLNVCVLDAMSCAKPVVGSDVAGNPLAIVDGVTGVIVPQRSPQALAAAIARLADDAPLRQRMGDEGRRRIEGELGWPALTRRYVRHFQTLAGRTSRSPVA